MHLEMGGGYIEVTVLLQPKSDYRHYKRLLGRFAASHPLLLGATFKVDVKNYISLRISLPVVTHRPMKGGGGR
jgi:hypothetical protein